MGFRISPSCAVTAFIDKENQRNLYGPGDIHTNSILELLWLKTKISSFTFIFKRQHLDIVFSGKRWVSPVLRKVKNKPHSEKREEKVELFCKMSSVFKTNIQGEDAVSFSPAGVKHSDQHVKYLHEKEEFKPSWCLKLESKQRRGRSLKAELNPHKTAGLRHVSSL